MRRDLVSAERVRLAAKAPKGRRRLVLVKGRSVLTDEARDLAVRLGVELAWTRAEELVPPAAPESAPSETGRSAGRAQVALASDHGGYACRRHLARELEKAGYAVRELGCPDAAATDYPVWARALAECVAAGEASLGIMLDTVGVASAMVCNRVAGVRAAACESRESALSSRRHNDANVLTLGGRLGPERCLELALAWLQEPYEGGRHQRRVEMIAELDRRSR
jgi:ribose 5-phosphate isomerase B